MFVIAGQHDDVLSVEIASILSSKLLYANVQKFADGEISVSLEANLYTTVIICFSIIKPVNECLIILLLIANAAKRMGATNIIAAIPYLPYCRQNKPQDNHALGIEVISQILNSSCIDSIISLDMPDFYKYLNKKFINISAIKLAKLANFHEYVIVMPDDGASQRYIDEILQLGYDFACLQKKRYNNGICKSILIRGKVNDKKCLIIDDIVDSGNTIKEAAKLLLSKGAKSIECFVTHAIASKFIPNIHIQKIITTNSIPFKIRDGVEVISVAKQIADASTLFTRPSKMAI